jgi:hypothetical protein
VTAPYQPSTGLSSLQAKVLSVDGNLAAVQDQLGRQLQVRRDWMRAKGTDLPQPGEVWMITKEFGNVWSFGLLISPSTTPVPPTPRPAVLAVASQAARDALTDVVAGQMVIRLDSGLTDVYNGSSWHGVTPLRVASPSIPATGAQSTSPFTAVTISIPDPGWPYQIAFSGSICLSINNQIGLDIVPRDGSNTGANLIPPNSIPALINSGSLRDSAAFITYMISGTTLATLTGSRTVHLTLSRFGGTNGYQINGGPLNKIYAELKPVP